MEEVSKIILAVLAVFLFAGIFGLLLAFPIMWCWNYAVVSVFGLPALTWGKAWCLNFLAGCLIKSQLTK